MIPLNWNKRISDKIAYELEPKEIVELREMVMTNTIQIDTMYQSMSMT